MTVQEFSRSRAIISDLTEIAAELDAFPEREREPLGQRLLRSHPAAPLVRGHPRMVTPVPEDASSEHFPAPLPPWPYSESLQLAAILDRARNTIQGGMDDGLIPETPALRATSLADFCNELVGVGEWCVNVLFAEEALPPVDRLKRIAWSIRAFARWLIRDRTNKVRAFLKQTSAEARANDMATAGLISPGKQAEILLGKTDDRDQVRRLQITKKVREKAKRLGFPLDIDDRGNKGAFARRDQWQLVADVYGVIRKSAGTNDEAAKRFCGIEDPGRGRASYLCDLCTDVFTTSDPNPRCKNRCDPSRLRRLTPRKQ